ncbi:MAG: putative L-2,4-diaminobutyrate decarboxylase [Actinomycetota bacterium]
MLHGAGAFPPEIAASVAAFIAGRTESVPLGRTRSPSEVDPLLHGSITSDGLGAVEAWRLFGERVVANTVGLDSERFLAFIPAAPSAASVWMDAAVSAASFSAESWLEAAGAVAAENRVLRWFADLVGFPAGAGGCFVSGGSIGNLSALAVARDRAGDRTTVAVSDTAHSSVANSLRLLGLDRVVRVPTSDDGRFTGELLRRALDGRDDVGIIVASAGSTNAGVVDDLAGLADVADESNAWFHVDGAYGAAALLLVEQRHRFAGLERADSLIVDPHKWLFATLGSCALLYRDPTLAAAVHTQRGPYIDVLHGDEPLWNPSDYAMQLTRRASGLPLWFSLATHGVDAHAEAVRAGVALAARAARVLESVPGVSLVMEPELGVVLFRRRGWGAPEWGAWADSLLADGVAFVAPSRWKGETVGRLVFLHPSTPVSLIDEIARRLA